MPSPYAWAVFVARNVGATALSYFASKIWTHSLVHLSRTGRLSKAATRKVMHIGTAPLFTLTWPLYSGMSPLSRFFAGTTPLLFALSIACTPGGRHHHSLIKSVQRSTGTTTSSSSSSSPTDDASSATIHAYKKNPHTQQQSSSSSVVGVIASKKIASGPFAYAVSTSLVTMMSWTSPHTFVALAAMAFGDGMADVVGSTVRRWYFQLKPKTWFTNQKSLPGSTACFISTVVMAFVWQNLSVVCGVSSSSNGSSSNGGGKTVVELLSFAHIVKVATITTLVELLPFEDNYVVPFTGLAVSRALAAR